MPLAAIGIGSNLGDAGANVGLGVRALATLGGVTAVSHLYRTRPWGKKDQPDFSNAVALLQTDLTARELLLGLKDLERDLGRVESERWGPRAIDFDILLYGDQTIAQADLRIPHPLLMERAFALVPLADLDGRYACAVAALPALEREGVVRIEWGEPVAAMLEGELQSAPDSDGIVERVRELVRAFLETDLRRLRVEDAAGDSVELQRRAPGTLLRRARSQERKTVARPSAAKAEAIAADLVGIVHFSRPHPKGGDELESDRELAYVEALGIRNPVRSRGPGRILAVRCKDGQPVEYGQVLFEIERS